MDAADIPAPAAEDETHIHMDMEISEDKNATQNKNITKKICKRDLDTPYKDNSSDAYSKNIFLLACIIGIALAIYAVNRNPEVEKCQEKSKYQVYPTISNLENKNGKLKHVHLVLDRIGYENTGAGTPWDLLWSHDYPFGELYSSLQGLQSHQKVNHFPGTGYITRKVDFASTDSKYIPKAFQLPQNTKEFIKYAENNKKSLFLEKHIRHRGVCLKNVSEIDTTSGNRFVQEYVQKPFLVDGHKFDIGVYVVLTSVNPLRVYWYKGDVLFRYCPAKYYPFDPRNLDKYVIADDYLPTWQVPSLAHPYTALGFGMKQAFDVYVRSKGKDPSHMWEEVLSAITDVFSKKEHHIVEALKRYRSTENFFEMMRFDLIVDEDLRVYLLEANMSPNLSSDHFPQNQLLYEQVLYNLFSITGVRNQGSCFKDANQRAQSAAQDMVSSLKNIAVFGSECSTICKDNCEAADICKLCKTCLDGKMKSSLLKAHKEFLHRGDFRRLIPPSMVPLKDINSLKENLKLLTPNNKLQYLWYQGKCNEDITWCT